MFKCPADLKISISLHNPTSKISLADQTRVDANGKKSKPDEAWSIRIVEFLNNGLILDIPKEFCSQGQKINARIETSGLSEDLKFDAKVKIKRLSLAGPKEAHDSVEFEWVNLAKDALERWNRLVTVCLERQGKVDEVFQAMKGAV